MAFDDARLAEALLSLAEDALRGEPLDVIEATAGRLAAELPGDGARARIDGLLALAKRRCEEVDALRMNQRRLAEAQRVGAMGSYDWHIPTDTNSWSDELYRIYGTEPQSFNASYERFMGFIHPDDREKVKAVHLRALQDHGAYHMEERIVRPNGEVRILDSTGEVSVDADGNPERMYGICRDITDQRRAEEAARRQGERFESLVESSPDALLVVNRDGDIVQVNKRTEAAFGYSAEELIGRPIEVLLPAALGEAHRGYRAAFMSQPTARPMGTGLEVTARHKSGAEIPVDVALGVLSNHEGQIVAAFVRDISERKRADEMAMKLHDADVRRRHALEINDNVVQGLCAALYAFDSGLLDAAATAMRTTMASARLMMNDLLAGTGEHVAAGELARVVPAASTLPSLPDIAVTHDASSRKVLLIDDSKDIRLIMRRVFNGLPGFEVVGEACDGRSGIEHAVRLRPDVVVLDLAMPVMDGLEALPVIRSELPQARIIVLSGFDSARMRRPALSAGADAYVEKGGNLRAVLDTLEELVTTEA